MRLLRSEGFQSYLESLVGLLAFSSFATLTLTLTRLTLLFLFRAKLDPASSGAALLAALKRGMLFDLQVGFYFAIPLLLLALAGFFVDTRSFNRKLLAITAAVYTYATALNAVISYEYIKEYGDLYNDFLFGLVFDDREAILKMIWREYSVVPLLLGAGALGFLLHLLWRRFHGRVARLPLAPPRRFLPRLGLGLLLLAVAAVFGRGGIGPYPIQYRDRDATGDAFLNKLVINPWSALHFAVQNHLDVSRYSPFGKDVKPSEVAAAASRVAPGLAHPASVDQALTAVVRPSATPKARHLFLILVESYDSWPFLDEYRDLHLVDEGKKLASEGLFLRSFVSTASGTMTSLSPMISGLYNPGIRPNYLSSPKPYETAPAAIFRENGFRTRLISGGSLSWQRLGDFAARQGFDERLGMESIRAARTVNEWGVDDGSLFDFVLSRLDDERPSFNLILTTGNHPSYKHDVAGAGWTGRGIPDSLKGVMDGTLPEIIMGHLWYSDLTAARFAREVARRYPDSVVAITGDHFSRKFLNNRPNLYERTSVPLLLYGPGVIGAPGTVDSIAAAHLDILPTFYQLALPEGTAYRAVGSDILDPARVQLGYGMNSLHGPGYAADLKKEGETLSLSWKRAEPDPALVDRGRERLKDLWLLSWWRIARGNQIK